MRILLLSDSHGMTDHIDAVLAQCGRPDLIVHCGDIDRDCDYIARTAPAGVPLLAVRGNNDWYSDRPYHAVETIDGVRLYITHGHQERVKAGPQGLLRAAKAGGCQAVFYGHTHRAADITAENVQMINPGALSGAHASYAEVLVQKGCLSVQFFELS
ncbi:MAG: metallophosphoesterase family protein [Clostridia bacterium]